MHAIGKSGTLNVKKLRATFVFNIWEQDYSKDLNRMPKSTKVTYSGGR
jgi:hypothetical protein